MSYDWTQDPGDGDLQAFLTAQGLWNSSWSTVFGGYATGAVHRFELSTGRHPMLAGTSTTLNLIFDGADATELPFPFRTISVIHQEGRELGYSPGPRLAQTGGWPIEWLTWDQEDRPTLGEFSITGQPGSFSRWPEDAYLSVLAGAAADFVTDQVSALTSGGLARWKEGDSGETFDGGAFADNVEWWRRRFEDAVQRYRVLGLFSR